MNIIKSLFEKERVPQPLSPKDSLKQALKSGDVVGAVAEVKKISTFLGLPTVPLNTEEEQSLEESLSRMKDSGSTVILVPGGSGVVRVIVSRRDEKLDLKLDAPDEYLKRWNKL